jgi:hypothetical protein
MSEQSAWVLQGAIEGANRAGVSRESITEVTTAAVNASRPG